MAFENDPDGYRMAVGYAGNDFDKPKIVQIEVLREYDGEWTLDEFNAMIAEAIARIPEDCRSTARVEMHDPGYDSSTSLQIYYTGPESAATVAERIASCEGYVAESRRSERAQYERLKAKFG